MHISPELKDAFLLVYRRKYIPRVKRAVAVCALMVLLIVFAHLVMGDQASWWILALPIGFAVACVGNLRLTRWRIERGTYGINESSARAFLSEIIPKD